jgi:hypothetical protein
LRDHREQEFLTGSYAPGERLKKLRLPTGLASVGLLCAKRLSS